MPKASREDVDTLYMETVNEYGKPLSDSAGKLWRDVLSERFSIGEIDAALQDHKSDTSRDFKGAIRGEQLPTPASIKYRIEAKRSAKANQRFYCGDSDCFGMWRALGPNTRTLQRCSKCEALKDAPHPPPRTETYEEHILTPGYLKAKADLDAALQRVLGAGGKRKKIYYQNLKTEAKKMPDDPLATDESRETAAWELRKAAKLQGLLP